MLTRLRVPLRLHGIYTGIKHSKHRLRHRLTSFIHSKSYRIYNIMIRYWPLLFIVIPLTEIYLFIKIGGQIGALTTVLIVLATAFIGVNLLRFQGLSTLQRAQHNMAQGQMPAMEMMEGLVLAVGGALLITPGFLTDVLGFLCLIPGSRRALIRYLMARVSMQMQAGFGQQSWTRHGRTGSPENGAGPGPGVGEPSGHAPGKASAHHGNTIEGEYRRED